MLNWIVQINNWVALHNETLSAWASLITIVSLPVVLIGLILGYKQIRDILIKPDPTLEFVHPTSVAYKLVNKSKIIAEDIIVAFGIFDLDSPQKGPLPIPSENCDWVNKESEKGPMSLLANYATKGHRYFGIVYIGCKGGERQRTYWIYVVHGEADKGFYAERNKKDTYEINITNFAEDPKYLETLVPLNRRRAIQ